MENEFKSLPREVENYRNRMNAGYWNTTIPRSIVQKWHDDIESASLYNLGEAGVELFLKPRRNLSEKNLICFAIQAEISGRIEMANGFWKQAYLKSMSPSLSLTPNKRRKKSDESLKLRGQETSKLKVFLCHSSSDKLIVEKYYDTLKQAGVEPWLDKVNLIPGQEWQIEIPKAVESSHVVIVFLSAGSVNKEGYIQKEIRIALDVAEEKPTGTIFIIPAKLEDCEIPYRLSKYQAVDLFERNGYPRLLNALQIRAESLSTLVNRKI